MDQEQVISMLAETAPRSIPVLFIIQSCVDDFGNCRFTKKIVNTKFSRSWTKFRNDLRDLALNYLIDFEENEDFVDVHLNMEMDSDDDDEISVL